MPGRIHAPSWIAPGLTIRSSNGLQMCSHGGLKMALLLQSSCLVKNQHLLVHDHIRRHLSLKAKPGIIVQCQDSSEVRNPTVSSDSPTTTEPAAIKFPSRNPVSSGRGFGSAQSPKLSVSSQNSQKKQKGTREKANVTRRSPVEKPAFFDKRNEKQVKELAKNESAFLLAWLGLGGIILVEGITLAASGFLPEEWDKLFVKYLYPSFTPTVALFVAGTVVYGVLKYLQNENLKNKS